MPSDNPPLVNSLAWLLDPVLPETFLTEHWECAPLFVCRSNPHYYAGLPGLGNVDELITATTSRSFGTEDVRILRTDEAGELSAQTPGSLDNGLPDIQAMYRDYQQGCSLAINHLHRRSAALSLLSGTLEGDLHHQVGINLYLTPRASQGFRPHVDTHDVFVLQVHGTKDWFFAEPLEPLPLASMKVECDRRPLEYRKITLSPGDLLYLPRGFPHFARTNHASSLHYTVGIEPYRWVDLVSEALQQVAQEDAAYRHALPPGFCGRPADRRILLDYANALVDRLHDDTFAERLRQRMESRRLRSGKATASGHFASLDNAFDLSAKSTVVHFPGVHCRVRETDESAIIDFTGNFVSGPASLAPALRFVATTRRFAVGDLPGALSVPDKIDLVQRLIGEGLLQIAVSCSQLPPKEIVQ